MQARCLRGLLDMLYFCTRIRSIAAPPAVLPAGNPSAASGMCVGDCNGDMKVTVNEVIAGPNIALGSTELSMCPAFDKNGDSGVDA
jgi:hypothetical protein